MKLSNLRHCQHPTDHTVHSFLLGSSTSLCGRWVAHHLVCGASAATCLDCMEAQQIQIWEPENA